MKPMAIFVILTLVAALVPMIVFAQKQTAKEKAVNINIPYKKICAR